MKTKINQLHSSQERPTSARPTEVRDPKQWTEPIEALIDLIGTEVTEARQKSASNQQQDQHEWNEYRWMESIQQVTTSPTLLSDLRRGLYFSGLLLGVGAIGLAFSLPGLRVGQFHFGSSTLILSCFLALLGGSCSGSAIVAHRLHCMGARLNQVKKEPGYFLWVHAILATLGIGLLVWTASEFGFVESSGLQSPVAFRRAVVGLCCSGLAIQFHYVRLLFRSLLAT